MATVINAWNISSNRYIFENCTSIVNINCNNIEWSNNNAVNAFANCCNLKTVTGLNNKITNIDYGFYNCQNLTNVEWLPDNITQLYKVFECCKKLSAAPTIPNSVTNLYYTFNECTNLQTTPVIPTKVTSMIGTFVNCNNLQTPPDIPASVINMYRTFYNSGLRNGANISNTLTNLTETYAYSSFMADGGILPRVTTLPNTFCNCTNLVHAPEIPNSVINMPSTFQSCSKLEEAPIIPSSVTNLYRTFAGCTKMTNMPGIPNSVTNMDFTFSQCSNLSQLEAIPLSVRSMYHTFNACTHLPSSILILSKDITNAEGCFNGTSATQKDVFLPFKYINNTATPTYNAFIAAGYSTTDYSKDNTRIHDMDIANVTVYPVPADANVILTATGYTQSGHMITVRKKSETFPGVEVDWEVNKWGYYTESNSVIPEQDVRIDVTMTKRDFTLTVEPLPNDSTITLTVDGQAQETNTITAPYETPIHWKVEHEDYFTQEDDLILEDNILLFPKLIKTHYDITINPVPASAEVTLEVFTAKHVTTITDLYAWRLSSIGTVYTVSNAPQPGDKLYNENHTQVIAIEASSFTILMPKISKSTESLLTITGYVRVGSQDPILRSFGFSRAPAFDIKHTEVDYDVDPDYVQTGNTITVPYLSKVHWSVAKESYHTASGDFLNVDSDINETVTLIPETAFILDTAEPGEGTIVIPYTGIYEVLAIGGGGGAAALKDYGSSIHGGSDYETAGGGSGALLHLLYRFEENQTLTYTVGAGGTGVTYATTSNSESATIVANPGTSTTVQGYLIAGSGSGGQTSTNYNINAGGAGGTYSYSGESWVRDRQFGNTGAAVHHNRTASYAEGGAATYLDYGKGGNARSSSEGRWAETGTNGYVKIVYLGPAS